VLPDLVQARGASRRLRVWSAACSSGQEPYSLSIELQRSLPAGWGYEILATDISTEMLDRARKGEFSQVEVNRGLPAHALLTKADKLGRGQQTQTLHAVRRDLFSAFGDTVSVQTFSGESKQGVDEARAVVGGWLQL